MCSVAVDAALGETFNNVVFGVGWNGVYAVRLQDVNGRTRNGTHEKYENAISFGESVCCWYGSVGMRATGPTLN